MTKPTRRDPGQGGLYPYKTKSGEERWYIKLAALDADGQPTVLVRRRARKWAEPARPSPKKPLEHRAGLPFTEKWEALAELDAIRADLRAGTYWPRYNPPEVPAELTTGQWLDRWLDEDLTELVADQRMRASTLSSYRKNVRVHIKPELGDIPLASLTGDDVKRMRAHLRRHGRKDYRAGDPLSPRTVSYCAVILQAALTDAVEQGLIPTNPALQRARRGRDGKSKPGAGEQMLHVWTVSQMDTFLDWCETTAAGDHVAYSVLATCGLRRGECLALRWRDVSIDWKDDTVDAGKLLVSRAVSVLKAKGEPERIVEDSTKTGVARAVALDPDTVGLLRRWRRQRADLSLALVRPDALVFGTIDGQWRHPERFSRLFGEKVAQCRRKLEAKCPADDLPPVIRLHDLRHTCGTQLFEAGESIKVIAEYLGHDEVVLLRTYAHLRPDAQEDMVRRRHERRRVR